VSGDGAARWAVVLGASSGTGAAIARAVAADPALSLHVFGAHRGNHDAEAEAVIRDVTDAGRRAHFRRADVGTALGCTAGAEELIAVAGPRSVKLFVHSIANASVGPLVTGEPLAPWQFHKTFDAMAHSFAWWAQELSRRDLLAPGALLLGLSNPMVDQSVKGTALIAASKAALEAYVRHLARELGPRGHRVNLLKFGAIVTEAMKRTFRSDALERLQATLPRAVPAGRLCTAAEVARLVCVLAGDAGAFFNGATIDFTGGETQSLLDVLVHPEREE
jgi:NAD(P)-dependent dehydrogenase (short-subunit alcohol dehydrogenase family)